MPNIDGAEATLEDVKLIFKNFEGRERQYNAEGDRNFSILLEPQRADELASDGWPVRQLKVREDDLEEDPEAQGDYHLPVKVKYSPKAKPPVVFLITSRGRTHLHEEDVKQLDWVDITHVDVAIRAKVWDIRGEKMTSVYLKAIYVTIEEDELALKYADVPVQG